MYPYYNALSRSEYQPPVHILRAERLPLRKTIIQRHLQNSPQTGFSHTVYTMREGDSLENRLLYMLLPPNVCFEQNEASRGRDGRIYRRGPILGLGIVFAPETSAPASSARAGAEAPRIHADSVATTKHACYRSSARTGGGHSGRTG